MTSLVILALITLVVVSLVKVYVSDNLSENESYLKHLITEHATKENTLTLDFTIEIKPNKIYFNQQDNKQFSYTFTGKQLGNITSLKDGNNTEPHAFVYIRNATISPHSFINPPLRPPMYFS